MAEDPRGSVFVFFSDGVTTKVFSSDGSVLFQFFVFFFRCFERSRRHGCLSGPTLDDLVESLFCQRFMIVVLFTRDL